MRWIYIHQLSVLLRSTIRGHCFIKEALHLAFTSLWLLLNGDLFLLLLQREVLTGGHSHTLHRLPGPLLSDGSNTLRHSLVLSYVCGSRQSGIPQELVLAGWDGFHHVCNASISRYGDVIATYIHRSKIFSHIYSKHQYRQESEYESTWCIIYSNNEYNYKVIIGCDTILQEYCITKRRNI